MIDFSVNGEEQIAEYLDQVRENIIGGIVVGMGEAMEGLAEHAASRFEEQFAVKIGDVTAALLESPRVTETSTTVKGTVSADVGNKHIGIWMDYGTSHPAVEGKLYHFADADGQSVFSHGHRAFKIEANPFLNPSLEEYKPEITDLISQRVAIAIRG